MKRFSSPSLQADIYGPTEDLRSVTVAKIDDVRENADDPFIVWDLGDVIYKYRQWKELLPRVHPFYAVKCNPNDVIMKLLSKLGANFDCGSKGEIRQILRLGVDASRIIYAHPIKQVSHLQYAAANGIKRMTFDNTDELHKIKKIYPSAELVLRFQFDEETSDVKHGGKYGCHVDDTVFLLRLAKDLGLQVVGTCFHVGACPEDPQGWYNAIRQAHVIHEHARSMGHQLTLLDIGGGMNGHLQHLDLKKYTDAINSMLDEYFPPDSGVEVIAEPGRYFVSSAANLLAGVIGKRHVTKDDNMLVKDTEIGESKSASITHLYLNVGLYNAYDPLHYKVDQLRDGPPVAVKEKAGRQLCLTRLFGPGLPAADCIYEECLMQDLDIGEWLLFKNFGDYRCTFSGEFQGLGRPVIYYTAPETALPILQQIFKTK